MKSKSVKGKQKKKTKAVAYALPHAGPAHLGSPLTRAHAGSPYK